MPQKVFDDETRRAIEASRLVFRRALAGEGGAQARSRRAGRGLEFHDHRGYLVGDDLRHLDWNLYGRLGELFVKRFRAEADLELRIILDRSASMALGSPPKALLATRIAGALAALFVAQCRELELHALGAELQRAGPTLRSAAGVEGLFAALESLPAPAGRARLEAAAADLAAPRNRLAVIVSDFLDDPEHLARLVAARSPRCDLVLIAVLAPDELDFEPGGFVDFVDAEGGPGLGLIVDEEMVAAYRRALEERLERCAQIAAAQAAHFILLRSDLPLAEALHELVLRGGLAR